MGVPKFFRYISERYPCLSELAREEKMPDFDNLYLDMNGIIHNCSHPDDANIHFRMTEEEMFRDIFNYIDKLFFMIKPKKVFFLAVDGVAPRAKMNQQRSRRFRSAKEAETLESNAKQKGEILPTAARFDSNCITPGTEFMTRLHEALRYFIKMKISTSRLWQGCRVILSGHETPGEGEHKIMEYIRYLKSQKEYDPGTRHCLYGLDADLIILGLCTHEINFILLREEVQFGKKRKRTSAEETRFFLLHLSLLRDYLELEFQDLKSYPEYDIDKIIDDWILMGFVVGNDFIPHLPNMHIHSNALPTLYKAYKTVWPELGGYINETGCLNLERLEKFFSALAAYDMNNFEQALADLKYLESKRIYDEDLTEAFDFDVAEIKNSNVDVDLEKLIKDSHNYIFNSGENDDGGSSDGGDTIDAEFKSFKRNYYITKLKYAELTSEVLKEQAESYVTALQWILYYYYKGVPSWSWFYPHHYAPFVSDLQNFTEMKIDFDLGKPFLPFEQLLAVLPAASKQLLPNAFQHLMTSSNSSLIEYYPDKFETDLNGKRQDWEAVVLIPFIDEKNLLKAMEPCMKNLTDDEICRNIHGPMFQYDFTKKSQGECKGVMNFRNIINVLCTETRIWREDISDKFSAEGLEEKRDSIKNVFYPGFPKMKYLKYTGELRSERVKVFEQFSRNENMILMPELREECNNLETVAERYLGKEVYIGWPHLTNAKVLAVSSREKRIQKLGEIMSNDPIIFSSQLKGIHEHHLCRMGIDFKEISVIVHAKVLCGTEYVYVGDGKLNMVKIWDSNIVSYPAQGIIKDIKTYKSKIKHLDKIEDLYSIGAKIFMLSRPYFGCEGKVIDPTLIYERGRLKVSIKILYEPDFSEAKRIHSNVESQYYNSYDSATFLGIQPNCLLRITGSILVIPGLRRENLPENANKIQIGLHLRFPKNNEELLGYTRRIGNVWYFSVKAINLIENYLKLYPEVSELIIKGSSKDVFFESDLYSEQMEKNRLSEITNWLKNQDHQKSERIPYGTQIIDKATLESLMKSIDDLKKRPMKEVMLQVKPHLIMKPGMKIPGFCKGKKLNLFDRIVVTKDTFQVPGGYKGTVISIHPIIDLNPVRIECLKNVETFYEILLDKELPEGQEMHGMAKGRIFKVSENVILPLIGEEDANAKRKVESFSTAAQTEKNVFSWKNVHQHRVQNLNGKAETITYKKSQYPGQNMQQLETNFYQKSQNNTQSAKLEQNVSRIFQNSNRHATNDIDSKLKPQESDGHNSNIRSDSIRINKNYNLLSTSRGVASGIAVPKTPSDPVESTEVLRQLLGIKVNHEPQLRKQRNDHQNNIPNLAVAENIVKPPKPPSSWFNNKYSSTQSTSSSVSNAGITAFAPITSTPGTSSSAFTKPFIPYMNPGIMPMALQNVMYPPYPPHQQSIQHWQMEQNLHSRFHSNVNVPDAMKANMEFANRNVLSNPLIPLQTLNLKEVAKSNNSCDNGSKLVSEFDQIKLYENRRENYQRSQEAYYQQQQPSRKKINEDQRKHRGEEIYFQNQERSQMGRESSLSQQRHHSGRKEPIKVRKSRIAAKFDYN